MIPPPSHFHPLWSWLGCQASSSPPSLSVMPHLFSGIWLGKVKQRTSLDWYFNIESRRIFSLDVAKMEGVESASLRDHQTNDTQKSLCAELNQHHEGPWLSPPQWPWSSGSNFMEVSSSPDSHKDENQSTAFLLVIFWVGILKYISILYPPSSTSSLPPSYIFLLPSSSLLPKFPSIISETLLHQLILS